MKNRLMYIDALRGFAILCVIFLHYCGFCLNLNYTTNIQSFLGAFFLPLFYFISGFVGYRKDLCLNNCFPFCIKKIRTLLIPTIIFFLLGSFFFGWKISEWLNNGVKAGYWFAFELFVLFFFYIVIKICTYRIYNQLLNLFFSVVLFLIVYYICYAYKNSVVGHFFSLSFSVYGGLTCFFCGILAGRYRNFFMALQTNKFYIYFLILFVFIDWNIFQTHWVLRQIVYTLLIFALFYNKRDFFEKQSFGNTVLPNLGKNSLAIYFLHYYLLFNAPECVNRYLNSLHGMPCFAGEGSTSFALMIIAIPMSLGICMLCIAIKRIIAFIPSANILLFGETEHKE